MLRCEFRMLIRLLIFDALKEIWLEWKGWEGKSESSSDNNNCPVSIMDQIVPFPILHLTFSLPHNKTKKNLLTKLEALHGNGFSSAW